MSKPVEINIAERCRCLLHQPQFHVHGEFLMHYNTFEVIDVDPREFIDKLSKTGFHGKILEINESYEY